MRASYLRSSLKTVLALVESYGNDLSVLWVSGLATLLVFCLARWSSLDGKTLDWTEYLVLGTLFPVLILALILSSRISFTAPFYKLAEFSLALSCIVVATRFALQLLKLNPSLVLITSALTFMAIAYLASATQNRDAALDKHGSNGKALSGVQRAPDAVASLAADRLSKSAARVVEFLAFHAKRVLNPVGLTILVPLFIAGLGWLFTSQHLTDTSYGRRVFVVILFLVLANLCHKNVPGRTTVVERSMVKYFGDVAAVVIICILSFRSDQLFGQNEPNFRSYHHWGYFIGPAELVREGGWLLWDVPSQYGFLNILLVALFPAKSLWQSLYLVNSALIFLAACFLFFMLRSLRTGRTNYWFSVALAVATTFLLPARPFGPQIYPSIGAFRFFWCYVLLAILVWEFRTSRQGKSNTSILWIGCITWVIGTLWSAESAAYSAGIWLPAYMLILWRKADGLVDDPGRLKKTLGKVGLWLLLPCLLLLLSLVTVIVYYLLFLGHVPDYRAFLEFAITFKSGRVSAVSQPLDWNGPLGVHFFIFCSVTTAVVHLIQKGLTHSWSLASGAWATLWTTESYFVLKGDDGVALLPIVCTVIAVILYLFQQEGIDDEWASGLKISLFPFFCLILVMAFGSPDGIIDRLRNIKTFTADIERQLPILNESARSLLDAANVKPGDPIIYVDESLDMLPARLLESNAHAGRVMFTHAWIPIKPFSASMPPVLSEDRIRLHISRFISRIPLSGYLLLKTGMTELNWGTRPPIWLLDQLRLTHTPKLIRENSEYQLIWFELKAASPVK